ncbi:hypothetical protein ACCAA_100018 [Candidatus Accumulibacter aalborgensis]|uniref:Uncharacterized protein n=1 Tax=Candidatus Accumulibacter aalborgensis TaxID=1860102 RepID=A0A1A8XDK4_9PROT|nr:hypothetical protein ACCAA_100018 [Candidatus Accumulibacter aalborgensis]
MNERAAQRVAWHYLSSLGFLSVHLSNTMQASRKECVSCALSTFCYTFFCELYRLSVEVFVNLYL